mmetsp:Transcript_118865/g.337006  ORF Transcript_118865/g.337006 Transcript_118865/m.337006 type:complete len:699 (+) Transcript_118865:101-2197(+)|eukprot:CAMPEP_0179229534 /NCGR_PEP_ID=MMETSP0797-20121207/10381_1 /TAXON_ID=47934 /ORGANISM="Dinophysis acuminata, Strain DAEP01" /LENGTH=698 /DNA_ID=CAMNT_0020936601 /DNA_START=100 /DNA_END=2196 /DNA_ORIENTATION=+
MGTGASSKYAQTRTELAGVSDGDLKAQLKAMGTEDRQKLRAEFGRLETLITQVDSDFNGISAKDPGDVVPGSVVKTSAGTGVCGPFNDDDQTFPVRLDSGEVADVKIQDLFLKPSGECAVKSEDTFDWEAYVGLYKDLRNAGIDSREKAWQHWTKNGEGEGRKGGFAGARSAAEVYKDLKQNDATCEIPKTEFRAMSVKQLQDVVCHLQRRCETEGWYNFTKFGTRGELLKFDTINLYSTTDWLLKPSTKARRCSYVEYVASKEQKPNWFVSHWWGEPVKIFVACILQHAKDRELRGVDILTRLYWVCAYANNQWALAGDVVEDPNQSSFRKAMQVSLGTVSILDMDTVCYTRIWCGYEVYTSLADPPNKKYLYDMHTVNPKTGAAVGITDGFALHDDAQNHKKLKRESEFPEEVLKKAMNILIENCAASFEADRVHILNCIAGSPDLNAPPAKEHPNFTKLNRTLRARYGMSIYGRLFAEGKPLDDINKVLSESFLDTLFLELNTTAPSDGKLTDAILTPLAQSIPNTVETLNLSLSNRFCKLHKTQLTDASFLELAKALSPALRHLTLTFCNDIYLTNASLEAIFAKFPEGMGHANLNFSDTGITDFKIKSLPQSLTSVILNFSDTKVTDSAIQSLMGALPKLTAGSSRIMCNKCPELTKEAVKAVGSKLEFKGSNILFAGCEKIGDATVPDILKE